MAMNIGNMVRKHDKEKNKFYFEGKLFLEMYSGPFFLVPNDVKPAPDSPDYTLKARVRGSWLSYGSAWLGKMKGADAAQYVSLQVGGPGTRPIYVRAFPDDNQTDDYDAATGEGELFNITWKPSGARAAAKSNGGGQLNDAIPY